MTVIENVLRKTAGVIVPIQIRAAEGNLGILASKEVRDGVRSAHQQRYLRLVRSDIVPLPGEDSKVDREIIQSLIRAAQ